MFDRPARLLGRAGLAFVSQAGHDVESARTRPAGLDRIGREPGMGPPSKASLFSLVHRFGSKAVVSSASALYFDEDEDAALAGDQVDLDAVHSDVARDDAISSGFEESGSVRFALTSENLAVIHDRSARVGDGNAPHRGDTDR